MGLAQACNPSTQEAKAEDHRRFTASQGFPQRLYPKNRTKQCDLPMTSQWGIRTLSSGYNIHNPNRKQHKLEQLPLTCVECGSKYNSRVTEPRNKRAMKTVQRENTAYTGRKGAWRAGKPPRHTYLPSIFPWLPHLSFHDKLPPISSVLLPVSTDFENPWWAINISTTVSQTYLIFTKDCTS